MKSRYMSGLAGAVAAGWRTLVRRTCLLVAFGLIFLAQAMPILGQSGLTATSTTLSTSNATPGYGTTVVLSAAISPATATGKVYFFNGTTFLGMGIVRSGLALYPTAALPIGTNSITAQYLGDKLDSTSTSTAVTVTVSQAATSVQLATSAALVSVGDVVKLQANVSPKWASGTVNFLSGTTPVASCTLLAGKCIGLWTTATSDIGPDSITAVYAGDSIYSTNTSAAVPVTVRSVTSTVLTSTSTALNYGDSVTLTATVTPSSATGTVRFVDGAKQLGSSSLSSGVAMLTTTALTTGTHSISAVYSGDTGDGKSTSSVVSIVVSGLPTSITLASSATSSNFGDLLTFTATVTPSAAPGKVSFYNGSKLIGIGLLRNGTASLPWSTLPVGTNSLTAQYVASTNYTASSSSAVTVTVGQATPTLTLAASTTSITVGKNIMLTAKFSSVTVADSILITDNGASIGAAILRGGKATYPITGITAGSHSYVASYAGSTNYAAVTSAAVVVTAKVGAVKKSTSGAGVSQAVQLALGSGNLRVAESSTLLATLAQPLSSGTMSFFADGRLIGESAVKSGQAELVVNWKRAGAVSLVARYNGSTAVAATSSAAMTASVDRATKSDLCMVQNAESSSRALYKYLSGSSEHREANLVGVGEDENLLCAANAGSGVTVAAPEFTADGAVSSALDAAENGTGAAILAKGQDEIAGKGGSVTVAGGSVESLNANVDALFATMGGSITAKGLVVAARGEPSAAIAVSHAGSFTGSQLTAIGEASGATLRTGTGGGHIELTESHIRAANGAAVELGDAGSVKLSSGSLISAGLAAVSFASPLAGTRTGSSFALSGGRMVLEGDGNLAKSWFAVKGAVAEIQLTGGTLEQLTSATTRLILAESQTVQGIHGAEVRGSVVHLVAAGTALAGDVASDAASTATLELTKDADGKPSHWSGAASGQVTVKLDKLSHWTVTRDSQLSSLIDEDASHSNISCASSGCRVYVGGKLLVIR